MHGILSSSHHCNRPRQLQSRDDEAGPIERMLTVAIKRPSPLDRSQGLLGRCTTGECVIKIRHELTGRKVIHFPEAHHLVLRSCNLEGAPECVDAITVDDVAEARIASRERPAECLRGPRS